LPSLSIGWGLGLFRNSIIDLYLKSYR
jgi:hypothetical protein